MNKISGVYKITNTLTGDFYIGSSKNIMQRWATHKSPSNCIRQPKSRLYQDMTKYGSNNFTFEIIEETDNRKEREQYWIEQLNPSYNSINAKGLNLERRNERCKELIRKYRQSENGKENNRKYARKSMKRYNNQLCLYNGKTLTLNALSQKFYYQGIPHPTQEAKKYLLETN